MTNYFDTTFGKRPLGAQNCRFILDNKYYSSSGLPSDHSQLSWAIATYMLCKLTINFLNNNNNNNNNSEVNNLSYVWITLSWILILTIAVYISYSRIYIENCHTLGQIIFSSVFGGVCGFLVFYYEDAAVNMVKKAISVSPSESVASVAPVAPVASVAPVAPVEPVAPVVSV